MFIEDKTRLVAHDRPGSARTVATAGRTVAFETLAATSGGATFEISASRGKSTWQFIGAVDN